MTWPMPFRRREKHEHFGLVFLWWEPDRACIALQRLLERLVSIEGASLRAVYIVDNSDTASRTPCVLPPRCPPPRIVRGDNTSYEFSGWQVGIDNAEPLPVWLFANDRYETVDYPYAKLLTSRVLEFVRRERAAVGKLDAFPIPVISRGLVVSPWLRTAFFLISSEALDATGGLVSVDEPDVASWGRCGEDDRQLYVPGVSPRHLAYILGFLTNIPAAGYDAAWYRKLDVEADLAEVLRKVRSILNEQFLSARVVAAGGALLDLRLAHALSHTRCQRLATWAADTARQDPEFVMKTLGRRRVLLILQVLSPLLRQLAWTQKRARSIVQV